VLAGCSCRCRNSSFFPAVSCRADDASRFRLLKELSACDRANGYVLIRIGHHACPIWLYGLSVLCARSREVDRRSFIRAARRSPKRVMILSASASAVQAPREGIEIEGSSAQNWLTFRQALGLGGNVRKGEHGTTVVYADRFTPDEERGRAERDGDEPNAIPFLKRFTVFNTDQCEHLPDRMAIAPAPVHEGLILPHAEALIAATGADFRIGGERAFYSSSHDFIQVPRPALISNPSIGIGPHSTSSATGVVMPPDSGGTVGRLRLRAVREGRIDRRDDQRLRLCLPRHRADGAPCPLYRLLARSAARGRSRHRPRRQHCVEGGGLSARIPPRVG
jgi:N-terminal domain of anti-restriction factor ArdC/Zincin-like metallopeptidase